MRTTPSRTADEVTGEVTGEITGEITGEGIAGDALAGVNGEWSMTIRIIFVGAACLAAAACQTTRSGVSGDNICRQLKSAYQAQCNFTEEAKRRDCVVSLKTNAMAWANRQYPDDPEDPASGRQRAGLINQINSCDVRIPVDPNEGTIADGYWSAAGPDIYGQDYVCDSVTFELGSPRRGDVYGVFSCPIVGFDRMRSWRMDAEHLVLFNNDDDVIVFKRAGRGWRSLDGAIKIYR